MLHDLVVNRIWLCSSCWLSRESTISQASARSFATRWQDYGIKAYEDSDGAIQLARNPAKSGRTKHIDIRYHFLRDIYRGGKVRIAHVNSSQQLADSLTKPLREEIFTEHRNFFWILSKDLDAQWQMNSSILMPYFYMLWIHLFVSHGCKRCIDSRGVSTYVIRFISLHLRVFPVVHKSLGILEQCIEPYGKERWIRRVHTRICTSRRYSSVCEIIGKLGERMTDLQGLPHHD